MSIFTVTELKNARDFVREGRNEQDFQYRATVDVRTYNVFTPWRARTETRKVGRKYAGFWFFMDSGEYTPGVEMERLARPVFLDLGW